jgi:2-iminobutanoate/2-iminopropanoate deaminase
VSLTIVSTSNAPAAIGPYSQAMIAGGVMYTAGQIALDPSTGKMLEGDVAAQTERVMTNLTAELVEACATWSDVVKTTVYLNDMRDFPVVNEIYGRHIGTARPARSTVQVAGLPRGALVEIDAIAHLRH